MLGLKVDILLVLWCRGARFPEGFVAEEDELIVDLDSGKVDGVLKVVGEISQNGLQPIPALLEFAAVLVDVVELLRNQ